MKSDKTTITAEQTDCADGTRAMGGLLADMNHEIRTSMNGVLGMLDLLLDTKLDDAQHQYAKIAQDGVGSLLEVIEHIIDVSLIESSQFTLAAAPFDLRQEMETACAAKNVVAKNKGLQLHLSYPPPARLIGDAGRVRQMIACLARAAIVLAESGGISIRAEVSETAGQRCRVLVEVIADGLSAAGEKLTELLNRPVQTGAEALRVRSAGTGELVLCARLARAMGGHIGVDSPAQGSTRFSFSIDLPLAPDTTPAAQLHHGRRVLVADDNPVNQQVALHMLAKLGCIAEAAADGEQAVEMHKAAPYDLILMDCDMPRLDGYQATRRLRALENGARQVTVIALTACTTSEERQATDDAGMDDFLSKPIRPQILGEMLARWLPPAAAPAAEAPAAGCVDELEAVQAMFGADFAELAALYRNDSPPRIATLRSARADSDLVLLAKVAHALAGSSASIGAIRLCALSRELEMRAKNGMLDDFDTRVAAIEGEYRRVSDKIQAMLH